MAARIAIQYGVLTGPRVGGKFRQALTDAGYEYADDSSQADAIIAHSAGCFWLPNTAQTAVLINPPYWPEKSVKQRTKERTYNHLRFRRNGYSLRYWLWRSWWGFCYLLADASRHRRIARQAETYDLPSLMQNRRLLIIRSSRDEWLTPDIDGLAADTPGVTVVHIEGDHDNCWHDPGPYINAIKAFLG